MAPTKKAITEALRAAVTHAYHHDRDTLTVKRIRTKVEQNLNLDEGFFLEPAWKDQSKQIITSQVSQLDEEDEDEKEPTPKKVKEEVKKEPAPVKKPVKRASNGGPSQPPKRQKKEPTPSDDESALSSLADSDVSEEQKPKPKPKPQPRARASAGRNAKTKAKVESDDEDMKSESSEEEKPKPRRRSAKQESEVEEDEFKDEGSEVESKPQPTKRETSKPPESSSDELSDLKTEDEEDDKTSVKEEIKTKRDSEAVKSESEAAMKNDDSGSEMSVLLDEAPKPKRSRKSVEPSKGKKVKPAVEVTPDEAEIKKLQSQLVKCGIRKIWGIELKKAGDDPKDRIRYLKNMLKEIGMDGRFSDARAREIKEARELAADLEAVKGGDELWGVGRSSRSKKGKNLKEESESDDDEETFEPRAARAKAGLAFLGSESEDSD